METVLMAALTALISSTVGAIVGALVSKVKTAKRQGEQAKKAQADLMQLMTQNILMTCRLVIYSDKFSTDEKIESYIIYRDTCHANHQTKTYMDSLVGSDIDEYIIRHNIQQGGAS